MKNERAHVVTKAKDSEVEVKQELSGIGVLQNARHERFAQLLAEGMSQIDAYAKAGYEPVRANAARLITNDNVAARVKVLKRRAAQRTVTSVEEIANQLDKDREFARANKNSSAAVSATMAKAKVLGLIVDRKQHSYDFSSFSDEDLKALEAILAKQERNNLTTS